MLIFQAAQLHYSRCRAIVTKLHNLQKTKTEKDALLKCRHAHICASNSTTLLKMLSHCNIATQLAKNKNRKGYTFKMHISSSTTLLKMLNHCNNATQQKTKTEKDALLKCNMLIF